MDESHPPRKRSCLVQGCLLLTLAASAVALILFVPRFIGYFINRAKWTDKGIANYTITVANVGPGGSPTWQFVVHDGKVTNANQVYSLGGGFLPVTFYAVDELFDAVQHCMTKVLCNILQYDDYYGYPKRVGSFFFEGSWLQVMEFQPDLVNVPG